MVPDLQLVCLFISIDNKNLLCRILNGQLEDSEVVSFDTPVRQYEGSNLEPISSTPATNERLSSSTLVVNRMTPFGQRTNKFVLQTAFNSPDVNGSIKEEDSGNMEDDVIRRVQPSERCSLQVHQSQPEPRCRFMLDRIEDRVLDSMVYGAFLLCYLCLSKWILC